MLLFLNISGGEIVVILLLILMLFGPKSIPGIARGFGRAVRQIRDASSEVQREIRNSVEKTENEIGINKNISLGEELDITKDIDNPLN